MLYEIKVWTFPKLSITCAWTQTNTVHAYVSIRSIESFLCVVSKKIRIVCESLITITEEERRTAEKGNPPWIHYGLIRDGLSFCFLMN